MRNFVTILRQNLRFSRIELSWLVIYSFVFGFIFSFDKWGDGSFSYMIGLGNVFHQALISMIILLVLFMIAKSISLRGGTQLEVIPSKVGLLISLGIMFVTQGSFYFFIPPGFTLHEQHRLQLGRKRYNKGYYDMLNAGVGAAILSVLFFAILSFLFGKAAIEPLFVALSYILILSLIPFDVIIKWVEPTSGNMFGTGIVYRSRSMYILTLIFTVSYFLMYYLTDPIYSFFFALIVAILGSVLYYYNWEN